MDSLFLYSVKKSVLMALIVLVFPVMGHAEIFRCIDAEGRSIFGDSPCPDEAVVGNSSAHIVWREMRALVRKGYSINQSVGSDVESVLECQKKTSKFYQKVDALVTKVNRLSSTKHQSLYASLSSIKACGECRVSAALDCEKTTKQLDNEMQILLDIDSAMLTRSVNAR